MVKWTNYLTMRFCWLVLGMCVLFVLLCLVKHRINNKSPRYFIVNEMRKATIYPGFISNFGECHGIANKIKVVITKVSFCMMISAIRCKLKSTMVILTSRPEYCYRTCTVISDTLYIHTNTRTNTHAPTRTPQHDENIHVTVQFIPRNMHTVFALLCFVVVIHWLIFPYPSGLLHWHCGNLTIAPVPAKQPWWIWINTSCEFIMNDCVTTTKQSTTKPCAYFLGYTVGPQPVLGHCIPCPQLSEVDLTSQASVTTSAPLFGQNWACSESNTFIFSFDARWLSPNSKLFSILKLCA